MSFRLVRRYVRGVQGLSAFIFDLPLGYPFRADIGFVRDTGFGISAPNAYRLRDVIRHDTAMVLALVSILTLISRGLYIIISPQNIFDIRYVLAILYILYAIGTIVLVYQAIRDMENTSPIDIGLPERYRQFVRCPICLADAPIHELITLQCFSDAEEEAHPERAGHSFHESCIMEVFNDLADRGVQITCPLCRQIPLGYRRNYGPPRHGIFDNSRLMWYINSLFARRLPFTIFNWQPRFKTPIRHSPEDNLDRHYLQILLSTLPLHMFYMTQLVFFIRFIYFTLLLPFSWIAWAVVVGVTVLFLEAISSQAVDQLIHIAQLPRPVSIATSLDALGRACNYLFPRYTAPIPPFDDQFDLTRFQFIRRQLSTLFYFFWALVWHVVCKTIFYVAIRPWKIYLTVIFSLGIYHFVAIFITSP
ncbi:hypothetical protein GGR58DRAFT_515015 [Xylaria digitata]|nr:hypothetical protein GGR58DRAFT_515015 [Xylaria digitata]